MIVLESPPGLLLVHQAEHARTSAQIAAAWRRPERFKPDLWSRFVEAIRRHDDGWTAAEQSPCLDRDGRPHGFLNLPLDLHVAIWRESVRLARDDPYIAALITQHCQWLYREYLDPGQKLVASFIEELDRDLRSLLHILERGTPDERSVVAPDALLSARRLFSFFDSLSLMHWRALPPTARTGPLSFGKGESAFRITWGEKKALIDPWPFDSPFVSLDGRGLRVEKRTFSTSEELSRAMASAPRQDLRWSLGPARE
jgi:hypothetical protein